MTTSTYDKHREQFFQEWGHEPKPDQEAVNAYNKKRAEGALRARAEQAAPTGPRADEWTGKDKPICTITGAVNPHATGPVGKDWEEPVSGRWEPYGMNGAERFVPCSATGEEGKQ